MTKKDGRRALAALCGILLGALLGALLPLPGRAAAAATAQPQRLRGIDVSVWQGEIDFAAVRQAGIQVVYIRAGFDQTEDPSFARNSADAAAAGLQVGYYFYVTAQDTAAAAAQADYFYQLIRDKPADCRPAMDYESFGNLPTETVNQVALAFLTRLETLCGEKPLVYTDEYRARTLWGAEVAAYPLWVADYAAAGAADLPADLGRWRTAAGFQYTDDARVAGIDAAVDGDVFWPAVLSGHDPEQGGSTGDYRLYTVKPGDTLWDIACRYHTTVAAILQLNDIRDPNFILPGWVLRIPLGRC